MRYIVIGLLVFGFMNISCSEIKVKDKVEITNLCSDQFVEGYNELIGEQNRVISSKPDSRKSTEISLDVACEEFFELFSLKHECIAERESEDVVVKAKDHDAACNAIGFIDRRTKVPGRIDPSPRSEDN